MKTQITWERPLPDTILGEKIVVHTVYSSFDRAEIDKLQEECERRIGYALVGELSADAKGERMRLKERHKRDLKKAIEELTAEYTKTIENDFVFKPMAFTLYHLWQEWDAKEHSRISNTERRAE